MSSTLCGPCWRGRRSLALGLNALIALSLGACQGRVIGSASESNPGSGVGGSGVGGSADLNGTSSKGGGSDPATEAQCVSNADTGTTPTRRLTPTEYNQVVKDLFQGSPRLPAQTFAGVAVNRTALFDNDVSFQTPSAALIEQYHDAAKAIVAAANVSAEAQSGTAAFAPCRVAGTADGTGCAGQWISDFGKRAFRRPLTSDEITDFKQLYQDIAAAGFGDAIALVVQSMLESPAFLYRPEFGSDSKGTPTPYESASRLSFFLWNSIPDDQLMKAADSNALATDAQIQGQITRMLADPRAESAVLNFAGQWLEFAQFSNPTVITRDSTLFPGWTPQAVSSMGQEGIEFAKTSLWGDQGSLKSLFKSSSHWIDGTLAPLYGVAAPAGGSGVVDLDPKQRGAGFLTQSWWLAAHAHDIDPSPVKRGKFVLAKVLCTPPPPPPPNVPLNLPTAAEGDAQNAHTNRERLTLLHEPKAPSCKSCHSVIDPIGFAFENYDSVGHYRATDNGYPVDATGSLTIDGQSVSFNGAVDLASHFADSAQVRGCVSTQLFRFAFARTEQPEDTCTIAAGERQLASSGKLRDLVSEMAAIQATAKIKFAN